MLGAIASVQFGAALATHLFDQLGPAGTVLLRVATASIILVAIWTPRVRGRPRGELVLALAGILALTQGGTQSLDGLGVALALIAGCLWGAYIILNGRVGRAYERGTGVALSMCIASVALLPVGIASGGSHLIEPKSLAIGAAVGVLSSAIPYSFEQEALRRIAASVFGVLMSLEPAVAALAGLILLGQSLSAREVIGIALVVAASAGASRRIGEAPVDA